MRYFLTDHLGSIRVIVDQTGTVRERNDYYPFGGRYAVMGSGVDAGSRWKYNSKEEQTTGGLGFLDYGARMYDNEVGRWFGVDPVAEKYGAWTPYNYCVCNPLLFIDPTGKEGLPYFSKTQYGGNAFFNMFTFLNNVSANIFNAGIGLLNIPINGVETISNSGFGGLGKSILNWGIGAKSLIGSFFNYSFGTPLGQQMSDALGQYKTAAFWENTVAGSVSTLGGMALGASKIGSMRSLGSTGKVTESAFGNIAKTGAAGLVKYYPANNGFLGEVERMFLMPGQQISRFGSNSGKFFSPVGTPLPMRALPLGANTSISNTFKVLKPFEVQTGVIAPAFGQPGLGIQYLSYPEISWQEFII